MSHSIQPRPKSAKFSTIHQLREKEHVGETSEDGGTNTPPSSRQCVQKKIDLVGETGRRINRHRYAQIIYQISSRRHPCQSISVFIESMMREMNQRDDSNPVQRAAAATWALHVLSAQSRSGALGFVLGAILPAVYYRYDHSLWANVSQSIATQLENNVQLLKWNPFFSHSMLMEDIEMNEHKVEELSSGLNRVLKTNDNRRSYVLRIVKSRRRSAMEMAFRSWRLLTRQNRLLDITNRNKMKRFITKYSRLLLSWSFYQWKLILEVSKNSFYLERLHESAFQLENAKNQFQLECCRADRLIQATKQAKSKLEQVEHLNQELEQHVKELEAELELKEEEHKREISRIVQEASQLLHMYARFLSVLIDTYRQPLPYQLTDVARANSSESTVAEEEDVEDQSHTLELLVCWYNTILKELTGDGAKELVNLGAEFASGEVYFMLLHYVCSQESTPRNLIPDPKYIFQEINEMSNECGLATVLAPEDFVDMREHRIVQGLCELYERYIDEQWKKNTRRASMALQKIPFKGNSQGEAIAMDSSKFSEFVKESSEQLEQMQSQMVSLNNHEQKLVHDKMLVSETRNYLERERDNGALLCQLNKSSTKLFWSLKTESLRDIHTGNGTQIQFETTMESVEAALKKYSPHTARIFYAYARGDRKTMPEFAFWRLVEFSAILSDSLTKDKISNIFDSVVSPQLMAVLNSRDKGKIDMDKKTLIRAARQEMDIRHVTPEKFTEILVRIVAVKYGLEHTIEEKFGLLHKQLRVLKRGVLHPVLEEFYKWEVQKVIEFLVADLCRIFFFYLKKQENLGGSSERNMAVRSGGRFAAALSISFFLRILEDCNFLSDSINVTSDVNASNSIDNSPRRFVSSKEVLDMIYHLQSNYPGVKPDEVTFTIFLESFSLIACYWCPNPLVPLSRKLAAFVVVSMRLLSVFHTGTTLILADFPFIPLTGGARVDFNNLNQSDV